jgi:two-component system response regulator
VDKKKILLIEDNISDVELTLRALEKAQITNEVVICEDGLAALDYLFGRGNHAERDIRDVPALILLDLKLPKIEGLDVLRQIKADKASRRIPIVILTSSSEERDIAECYDIGINSFIRKPVDFNHFVDVVSLLGQYWLNINEPPPYYFEGFIGQ